MLALDYSRGMLEVTGRRLAELDLADFEASPLEVAAAREFIDSAREAPATRLVRGDIFDLGWLEGRVNVAIASNSITDDTAASSFRMFDQIAGTLVEGGVLLALFPSLDATLHVVELYLDYDGEVPEDFGHIDARGVYESEGFRQKFWTPEEIEDACKRNGLAVERLVKIHFPWSVMAECGWGDFEGEEEVWDWYLVARKI